MKLRQPIVISKKEENTEARRWSFQDIKRWNFRKIFIRSCLGIVGLVILMIGIYILTYFYQQSEQRNKEIQKRLSQDFKYFQTVKLQPEVVADAYAGKPTSRWKLGGDQTQREAYLVLGKTLTSSQIETMLRDQSLGGIPFTDLNQQQRNIAQWLILYVDPGDPRKINQLMAEQHATWDDCRIGAGYQGNRECAIGHDKSGTGFGIL